MPGALLGIELEVCEPIRFIETNRDRWQASSARAVPLKRDRDKAAGAPKGLRMTATDRKDD